MIPKNITRLSIILSIVIGSVFTSCVLDRNVTLPPVEGDATVTFALNVPGASEPNTRGLSDQDETNVATIDVLLFSENGSNRVYYGMVPGVSLENPPGNMKGFKAVVPVGEYSNYDITVIANGHDQVMAAGLVKGEPKSTALNKLVKTTPIGEKWNSDRIPMWGEALNVDVDASTNLSGDNAVKMTRMISRIDVKLSEFAASGTNEVVPLENKNDNFELVSVRLYNYSTKGTLVPDLENGWNTGNSLSNPQATAPNQPAGGYGKALFGEGREPLVYRIEDQHTSASHLPDSLIRAIYTLESPAGSAGTLSTNTCLVIGGKYKGGIETFYRIDFAIKNQDTQLYEYIHLLRNFWYTVNISRITGEGFGTPEEAFYSRPVNIEVEILEWNDGNLSNVVFDGQNYLSVSPALFEFYRDAREAGKNYGDNILQVKTDYTGDVSGTGSGWYVERIVDADDRNVAADWLTLSPESGGPKQLNEPADKVKLIFDENRGSEMRSAIVVIAAGRLRYEVLVEQSTVPDIMLAIVDPDTNLPVKELIFTSPVGVDPDQQRFKVDWRPENADLHITNAPVTNNPFPDGAGAPQSGTITGGNNGTGTTGYIIQPHGFTAAQVDEVDGDPFLERSSKIDFTVSNGASYESESIFLRQIHYNLLVDHRNFYLVDGSTYTLNVRSNAGWRIKEIIQDSNTGDPLLDLKPSDNMTVGTTGGYDISGEPVTFTMADNIGIGGYITVTFESTDSPKKFEDKTVKLLCALPKVKIMGLANYTHWGYNIAIAPDGGTNKNSAYHLLSSPFNFGLTPASIVPSLGFEFLPHDASGTIGNTTLQGYLDEEPDIIVLGQDLYIPVAQAKMYVDYLKKGGVLIAYNEGNGSGIGNLMQAIFEDTTITDRTRNAAGAVYQLPDIEDPILDGPFGNLRGLTWGEDASSTRTVDNIPLDKVVVYSNANDITSGASFMELTAFRHKEYNFVWFGDGGFVSSDDPTHNTRCPFMLGENNKPVHKSGYGRINANMNVYNSVIFANTVYWGILRALENN